jgi:hypothetical protein
VPVPPGEHAFLLVPERGASVGGLVKVRPAEYVEVSARGPAAVVEVRNRTGGPLSVSLNGIRLGTVEKDGSLNVAVAGAGPQTISASDPAGRREWRLDDVVFPASGSFGWTLKE